MHRLCNKYILAVMAFTVCLPMLLLTDIPQRDVAFRYAPMIQAFADFDWTMAFHPRIPMFHPVVGGIIALVTGVDAYVAAQLASTLFFALAILPLFSLMKRVFDDKTAVVSCFLYMLSPQLLRYASSGMRDSAKSLVFILAVYALVVIFQQRKSFRGYLWMGLACALMMLTRGDCVMYAFCFMVCMLVFELMLKKFPWKSILSGFLLLVVITPSLLINMKMIGYPVTEARFAVIMESVCDKFRQSATEVKPVAQKPKISVTDDFESVPDAPKGNESAFFRIDNELVADFIESVIKGFFPVFAIPALFMIVFRMRRREWKTEETILLSAFLGHVFLIIFQIAVFDRYLYVSRRYLLTVTPLEYGWAALFLAWAYSLISSLPKADLFRLLYKIALLCGAVGLYVNAVTPQIKDRASAKHSSRRLATFDMASFIKKDYVGPKCDERPAETELFDYCSFKRPVVAGNELYVLGYLSGGRDIQADMPQLLKSGANADYIAVSIDEGDVVPLIRGFENVRIFDSGKKRFVLWKRVCGGN